MVRPICLMLAAAALLGCRSGRYLDPNDPKDVGPLSADKMLQSLKSTSDMLNARRAKGPMSGQQYQLYIKRAAEDLLKESPPDRVAPAEAWKFAELYLAAQRWKEASALLRVSVQHAKET